jgi:hypothetical protein
MRGTRPFNLTVAMVVITLVGALGCRLLPVPGPDPEIDTETTKNDPKIEFEAREDRIERGECTYLEWEVQGAEGYPVFLDGELVRASGSESVCPGETTTYALVVGVPGDSYEERVVVQVESGPGPAPTSAPPTAESGAPVEVPLTAPEESVAANTPVVLRIGWITDAVEQIADFLGSVELVVTLDGQPLRNTGDHWSEIEEAGDADEDGDMDYLTIWRYPVGVLNPGTHRVESEMRLQRPVTDGCDADGDGVADEYSGTFDWSLQIVVEQ